MIKKVMSWDFVELALLNIIFIPVAYGGLYMLWSMASLLTDSALLSVIFIPFIEREAMIFEPGTEPYLLLMMFIVWPFLWLVHSFVFMYSSYGIYSPFKPHKKLALTVLGIVWGLLYLPLIFIGLTSTLPMLLF